MKRKVKHKVIAPNIVRGGQAIPMGNNFYYMKGRKHSQGGIDIGKNPRTGLEVEDGEIMEMSPKEVKVYSSVPFLNGKSPAQKVLGGENPATVFRQQEEYKDKNNINDDGSKNKKSMGGLKRSKDYGSKSKPYPNVDKKDFAGGNRSYPIPTKADAVDALRLAGLHGRSDVRAKVYSKYPELRKKAKNGIVYSLTNNGKTSLRMIPSTGDRTKAEFGVVRYLRNFRNYFAKGLEKSRKNQTKTPAYFRKNKTVKQVQREVNNNKPSRGYNLLTRNKRTNKPITNNTTISKSVTNKPAIINSNILPETVVTENRNTKSSVNKPKLTNNYIKRNNNSTNNKNNITKNINKKRLIDVNDEIDTVEAIKGISSNDFKPVELPKTYDTNLEKYAFDPHVYDLDVPFVERKKKFGGRKRAEWGTNFWKNIAEEQEKEKRRWDFNNKLSGNYNFNNAVILNTNDLPKAENTVVKGSIDNLNIPSYNKNNKNNKLNNFLTKMKTSVGNYFKDKDNVSDTISLGSNLLGNIISSGINSRMINNIQMPNKPTAPINKRATKLKTKININPQLANMRESLAAYERSVDENTSSSQVALYRKQRARAANLLNTNVLYANKENQETELINRDRLNQQSVANENIAAYNNYLDKLMDYENKKTEIENKKLELSAENKIATIENINNSIQNLLTNRQKRKSEKQNIAAMSFANPNLPAEMLYAQGLINKETYDAYRKAYPLKNT